PTPTPTPTGQAQLSAAYPSTVNAYPVWQQGATGQGVTVAVLDSGVAADPDLVQPTNRLLASVNFADQRLTSDPGGHGTHVAGIIAGNGTRSAGEYVGIAPQANTVGATDDHGTISPRDDTFAPFSAWGTADSNAKPDLVAPGRRIVSIRVAGSALDTLFPDRVVTARNGATYLRLTGTSMATPVVA